ncbi:hypothetical protein F4810DRAFT_696845 [Camillea tinctor]|nr:hypothetical protein F4810DRAFT_696845 [Camillea tinctor]
MASPHHCHQSSLEGIINFSPEHPLDTDLRDHATSRFHIICKHFDDITGMPKEEFSRPKLILYTYQYSLSQQSKDHFLRVFFHAIYLPIDDNSEDIDYPEIRPKFFDFGDYLFNNFFLPVKASTKQTPQPSPALHSAVQEAQGQGGQQHVGTTYRLSALRGECLIRDRHRCVISRRFDKDEAMKRYKTAGTALDDDGNLVANDPLQPVYLELGHILPHSLTKTNRSSKLVCVFLFSGLFN